MVRAAITGLEVNISDGPFDPTAMKEWGKDRTIRASVLRRMLVGQEWPVHAKGVRLRGLRIEGCLDLEGAAVRCPLRLRECYLDDPGPVILDYAGVPLLTLTKCSLGGLTGSALTVTKDFGLSGSFFTGPLHLPGADIGGSLNCDGAQLTVRDQDGNALVARGVKVAASVFLDQGFTAAGGVDLTGADIKANLTCQGDAWVTQANGDGNALIADLVKVGGDMSLEGVCVQAGAVRLVGADVSGLLNCRDAQLKALVAFEVKTGGDLLLDQRFTAEGGVSLTDAVIGGALMCSGARLTTPEGDGNALVATRVKAAGVWLDTWPADGGDRRFTAGTVQLGGADITGGLTCSGARLTAAEGGNALAADLVKVGGDMSLDGMCVEAGAVRLVGADVSGLLNCRGAQLKAADEDGDALIAFEAEIGSDLLLDQGFTAEGAVLLTDAVIGGGLRCSGARLTKANGDGNALVAARVKAANIWLDTWPAEDPAKDEDRPFTARGAVLLTDAVIGGGLRCSGARLTAAKNGNALVAARIKAANVWLDTSSSERGDQPFTAEGAVQLDGADISGALTCTGARLTRDENGYALAALGLKTGGDLLLDQGFTAEGAVLLTDAVIGGGLRCSGAHLNAADDSGNALVATRVKAANVWLDTWPGEDKAEGGDQPFTAAGTVQLGGADISGALTCSGARLTAARNGNALVADLAKIGGDTCLDTGFTAVGSVQFTSAHVDGSLRLDGAKLAAAAGKVALDATGAQITRELVWAPSEPVLGTVRLEDAQVGQLEDDWKGDRAASGYWPRADQGLLELDGFTYSRAGQATASLEQRLTWIGSLPAPDPPRGMFTKLWAAIRHPDTAGQARRHMRDWRTARKRFGFTPQPYEQLATVYQQAGHDSEARAVAIARRRDFRRYGTITRRRAAGNWLLDKTIQYGYQTWRAVLGIVVLYVVIFLLFWYAQHRAGLMVPAQSIAGLPATPDAAHCTAYYPCYYPAGYAIDTVIPLVNVHQASNWAPDGSRPFGWLWVYASWAGIVLGWALATLAVAGYTGLVRSPDSL
jgi:hypothetical protein